MIAEVRQRLRLSYRKDDVLMWVGHLDTLRLIFRLLRRGGIPFATSGKFSPKPRLTFGPPLPVGVAAEHEMADIELREGCTWDYGEIEQAGLALAAAAAPRDFVVGLAELPTTALSIAKAARGGRYVIQLHSRAAQALQLIVAGTLCTTNRDGKTVAAAHGLLSIVAESCNLVIDGSAAGATVFNVMRLANSLEQAGFSVTARRRLGLLSATGAPLWL